MTAVVELNPEIARQILKQAKSKGLPVELYLHNIIEDAEDTRLAAMREAAKDELFLVDLADETLEDFRHTDFE